MTLLLAGAVGFLAGRIGWLVLRPVLAAPVLARTNLRGRTIPTAGGLVLLLALVAVEALRALSAAVTGGPTTTPVRGATVLAAAGFALLGLVDDVAGDASSRGFRGHLAALARGRLTTGALKLAGGGVVAALAVATLRPGIGPARLLADAALVSLAANLANLLDRAPGRAIKAATLAAVVLGAVAVAAGRPDGLVAAAVVAGAALAVLVPDLRERVMLGDTGANLLGGVLGLAAVATLPPVGRWWVLAALAALNMASEAVSFSAVIERFPPLRAADRLGRLP